MSCYLKHIKHMYEELGVDGEDKEQRKLLDKVIRKELGLEECPCGEVWATLKPKLSDRTLWQKIKANLKK